MRFHNRLGRPGAYQLQRKPGFPGEGPEKRAVDNAEDSAALKSSLSQSRLRLRAALPAQVPNLRKLTDR